MYKVKWRKSKGVVRRGQRETHREQGHNPGPRKDANGVRQKCELAFHECKI